jgi:hypothetical protein
MPSRLARFAPLTGVLFAVLTAVAFLSGEETPDANATPAKVIVFFTAHKSNIETSAILAAVAFLFVVFWAGAFAGFLRRRGASPALTGLVIAAASLMAVGAALFSGIEYVLAHDLHYFGPQTAQTLNVLNNSLFLPLAIGGCVYGIASGLAILATRALPVWLGWVALVLGILSAAGPIGFIALLVLVVWTLVVSIMVFLRSGDDATPAATAAAA